MGKNLLNFSGVNGDFFRTVTNDSLQPQKSIKSFSAGVCFGCLAVEYNLDKKRREREFLRGRKDKEPLVHCRAGFEITVMFINRIP